LCLPVGSSSTGAEMARLAEPGRSGGSRRRHRLRRWRRLAYAHANPHSDADAHADYESNCGRHLHHCGDGHARYNHLARNSGDRGRNGGLLALVYRDWSRWEPPASAGGSDALASRKESHFDQSGFSPGFKTPRLKPEENSPTRAVRLESRAPPHECGGSHHAIWTSLIFSRPFGTDL
jgi:hypothetical protein